MIRPTGTRDAVAAYLRARIAAQRRMLRLLATGGTPLLAALGAELVAGVLPLAFVIATSIVVGRAPAAAREGLSSAAGRSLEQALLVAGGILLAQHAVGSAQRLLRRRLLWHVNSLLRDRILAASFRPPGVAPLEDEKVLTKALESITPQVETGWSPGEACSGFAALVPRYVQALAASVLIGIVYRPAAAAGFAVAGMILRIGTRSGLERAETVYRAGTGARRRRGYIRSLLAEDGAAKEIRVFGILPWIQETHRRSALAELEPLWDARRRIFYRAYLACCVASLALLATLLVVLARAASAGDVSLGELAFVVQAGLIVLGIGGYFLDSDEQTQRGAISYSSLEEFERLTVEEPPHASAGADPADLPRRQIAFESVTFSYPGADRPVLAGLDLVIPAGRSLAVVGLNGAGKTTLVKLLARLYDPVAGRITADGIDIREFRVPDWHRRVAAIFQDFVHYELSVADNVGFGAIELRRDEERIRRSLGRAGALPIVESLPLGLETTLSRKFRGGAELSGGEWQRIAIARALMAVEGGAGILVLDEPTASLDVRAEAEFFDRFLELTTGLTTVLISHRFASVRQADRIAVLENGVVAEDGTHAELMVQGGRYARLFQLQAARFENGNPSVLLDESL